MISSAKMFLNILNTIHIFVIVIGSGCPTSHAIFLQTYTEKVKIHNNKCTPVFVNKTRPTHDQDASRKLYSTHAMCIIVYTTNTRNITIGDTGRVMLIYKSSRGT